MINWRRQERIEPALAWLFPLTYLIHIAEEYLAGVALATAPSKISGANLTPTQFLILNGVAFLLMIAGMFISRRLNFRTWLMICLGMVVLVNGLFHVAAGLRNAGYNPGLISGLLIWMPLGIITLICLKKRVRPVKYWVALAIGVIINVIVLVIARSGRRLFEG
ncbi:MAG TPA: HXXEE domain-containing protein [Pyrinomonadaceae bacterium]|jgi:hypothetical protein|nr:HXXEE domain-containing protein [Pyrinomonadaceae bacterium]